MSEPTVTEAADWYARLRAEGVSEIDAARFRAWLARDPAHRQEFEELDALWGDLAALEHAPEIQRERTAIAATNKAARRRLWPWAAAASVLIAAGAGAYFSLGAGAAASYRTGVGEQRVIPLADGSVITLNTATEVRLHYSATRRAVELIAGQANFEVARDTARPFVVMAGGGEVRALGTIFDVYKSTDDVTVTLIEGKVAVAPPAAKSPDIVLAEGEQLLYAIGPQSVRRIHADLPRVSAWRERKLEFSDTPLQEAIAEANRYSPVQIELDAPELREARISGVFEAGKNELFVEGLQTYFHLNVSRRADRRIVLTGVR